MEVEDSEQTSKVSSSCGEDTNWEVGDGKSFGNMEGAGEEEGAREREESVVGPRMALTRKEGEGDWERVLVPVLVTVGELLLEAVLVLEADKDGEGEHKLTGILAVALRKGSKMEIKASVVGHKPELTSGVTCS